MSEINVTTIKNENADYGPNLVGYSTVTGNLKVTGDILGNVTGTVTGVASTALSLTVTDESTDTDCNLLFVTQSTGDVSPKTGSNLTFNSSNGQLTATSFSGDGQYLDNTGSTLSQPTSGSHRIVTTSATSGVMTTSGTTSELTYHYSENALKFTSNVKANFGGLLNIYTQTISSTETAFIDSGALNSEPTNLYIRTGENINGDKGSIFIREGDSDNSIVCKDNAVELYYNNSKKLETLDTGIEVSGDVNSTSDINLKKDIEVVTSSTEMLNQLRGVKFTWKENDEKSIGVIAQEVEAILPELVRGEEGNKSVNYSGLIGVLIEAVKELSARVEELEKNKY